MKTRENKKISKRNKFLIAVIIAYVLVGFFNLNLALNSIQKTFQIFVKIIPILLAVFIITTLVNLYLSSGKIKKHLGENSGFRGWIYSVVAGILISGPPYILFPLLGDLKKHGMKNSLLAVFCTIAMSKFLLFQ